MNFRVTQRHPNPPNPTLPHSQHIDEAPPHALRLGPHFWFRLHVGRGVSNYPEIKTAILPTWTASSGSISPDPVFVTDILIQHEGKPPTKLKLVHRRRTEKAHEVSQNYRREHAEIHRREHQAQGNHPTKPETRN